MPRSKALCIQFAAIVVGIMAFEFPNRAAAEFDNDCDSVLVANYLNTTDHQKYRFQFLCLIDESNFARVKAEGGLKILGVGADANYESFNEWRKSTFTSDTIEYNDSIHSVSSVVPEEARQNWLDCKKAQANQRGLSAKVDYSDDDVVSVTIKWAPPPGVTEHPKLLMSPIYGATVATLNIGRTLRSGDQTMQFHRRPASVFLLTVNLDPGYSATLFLPKQVKAEKTTSVGQNKVWHDVGAGDVNAVKDDIEHGFAVNGIIDTELNTPLHLAAKRANASMVRFLLANSGCPRIANNWHDTAIRVARVKHPGSEVDQVLTKWDKDHPEVPPCPAAPGGTK